MHCFSFPPFDDATEGGKRKLSMYGTGSFAMECGGRSIENVTGKKKANGARRMVLYGIQVQTVWAFFPTGKQKRPRGDVVKIPMLCQIKKFKVS